MGGGDRRVPLLGSLGGIGGASSLSCAVSGNLTNVSAFGGTRGTPGIIIDICRRTGEVTFSEVEDLSPLTEDARGFGGDAGFLGGISGGGSFSGKFSMLT